MLPSARSIIAFGNRHIRRVGIVPQKQHGKNLSANFLIKWLFLPHFQDVWASGGMLASQRIYRPQGGLQIPKVEETPNLGVSR
jgi:hypothetical protein